MKQAPYGSFAFWLISFQFVDHVLSKSWSDRASGEVKNDQCCVRASIQGLVDQVEYWQVTSVGERRFPFVTLTFAQSLDSKVAVYVDNKTNQTSANYPISGKESLLLTHALRSVHDAILIGGRTLSTDNPRLTNRLWKPDGPDTNLKQPRPVVLDSELRHVRKCLESGAIKATNLIVCCSPMATLSSPNILKMDPSLTILTCEVRSNGQLDLRSVLERLKEKFQIQSLMVEGGSAVISAFAKENLVDCLCMTIAPKILGSSGLSAFQLDLEDSMKFGRITYQRLGDDCIILAHTIQ